MKKKLWGQVLSVVSVLALIISVVPVSILLVSGEDDIPDVSSWKYVMAFDFEGNEVGKPLSNWGNYYNAASDKVVDGLGANSSKGLKVYNLSTVTGNSAYVQPFYADAADVDLTGAQEAWFWVDMSNYANIDKTNISWRPRIAGVDLYLKSGAPIYLQSGDGWVEKSATTSEDPNAKCAIKGADLSGYCGYIRVPLSSFGGTIPQTGQFMIGYMVYDFQFNYNENSELVENAFVMDNFLFAGPNMNANNAKPVKSLFLPEAPNVSNYKFKFVEDFESLQVGAKYENWGSYCTNVTDIVAAQVGADGTQGLYVYSTAAKAGGAYCQPFYVHNKQDDFSGAEEIWIWLDMTGYGKAGNLKIRPRFFDEGGTQYDPTMKSEAIYYLQDGDGWISSAFNKVNGESSIPGSDITGFVGYIRLPLSSFDGVPNKIDKYFGGYWIYDFNFQVDENSEHIESYMIIDNVILAGPSMTGGIDVSKLFDGSFTPDPSGITEEMRQAAQAARDAIAALPPADQLTLNDADKVAAARALYDAVDKLAAHLVDNIAVLVAAEAKIKELQDKEAAEAADRAAAEAVIKLIDDLKNPADITKDDIQAVKAAGAAYDSLTEAQKKLVTNKEKLDKALEMVAMLENRRPEDPDPSWKFLTLADFENLTVGYDFSSEKDEENNFKYMLYPQDNKGQYYKSIVTDKGYKGSKAYTLQGVAGNTKSSYAQPLLRLDKLNNGQYKDFTGAEELVLYVDFTNIKIDAVGFQIRLIENDFNADGTLSGGMTQWVLKEGAFVYILDDNGNWKKVYNTDSKYESPQYKLPVEVVGRVKISPREDSELYKDGMPEVKGYKGFIRIPLTQLEALEGSTNANNKIDLKQVAQFWMVFNYPSDQDSAYFILDQLGFVGHFEVTGQGEVPVLDYLPMSSGKTGGDTPETPDDNSDKGPKTGVAASGLAVLFAAATVPAIYVSRKRKRNVK